MNQFALNNVQMENMMTVVYVSSVMNIVLEAVQDLDLTHVLPAKLQSMEQNV